MEPRISFVTLGVTDIARARRFYESGLGWKVSSSSNADVVFMNLNGVILALWGRASLAEDIGVPDSAPGFSGVALAHNVNSREEVDATLALAERAGGKIVKPGHDAFWGGYTGYFSDPEGHYWEVAWNPGMPLDESGRPQLPE